MLFDQKGDCENGAKAFVLRILVTKVNAHWRVHLPIALTAAIVARIQISGEIGDMTLERQETVTLVLGIIPASGWKIRLVGLLRDASDPLDEPWRQS